MTAQTTSTSAPEANRAVVEGELRRAIRHAARRRERYGPHTGAERVLMLRAAPEWWGPSELTVETDEGPATATVRGCGTVLAVLDALASVRPTASAGDDLRAYLVLLTPCDDRDLGASVLAQALGNEVRPINRWDLVAEAFGARRLDPRLSGTRMRWLAEALLEVQPGERWQRPAGPVLQLDTAMARLAAVRFGSRDGGLLDAAALLEWARDGARVAQLLALRDEERAGLIDWLEETVGPVAQIVFRLLAGGQAADAVSFGIAAAELYAPAHDRLQTAMEARIRAEERFLGGRAPGADALRTFAEAAESLTLRWSDNGRAAEAQAICDRAEQILAELRAGDLAAESTVLNAGLDARLSALADAIAAALPSPRADRLTAVEDALGRLREHRRPDRRTSEVHAAAHAVRLVRWLAASEQPPATVAEGTLRHIRSWGWVDRATAVIWNPDTARGSRAREVYASLYEAVRDKRARLDRAFAERLASWTQTAGPTDELLLTENILERIARPVAERRAPLIIVVDGMSAAVACELAEQILAGRAWAEVGRSELGRDGALAAIPSATRYSRTSLLCGELKTGGQPEERAGFAAFWRGRRSTLFHKAGLGTGPGARLHEDVEASIGDTNTVVGVVLNTIDDALRDDPRVSEPAWRLAEVDHLPELLKAAANAGRAVILTSDHGHVLDRDSDMHPARAESARHRTGEPGDGELPLRGPRVLAPGGEVIVPWDERIRYTSRKAGYHGGVSPAEMVIPVLVFVPSPALCPKGWALYENPTLHEPAWWNTAPTMSTPATAVSSATAKGSRKQQRNKPVQDTALFGFEQVTGDGLGAHVVASELFAGQRAFVRKAPDDTVIAALIDRLAAAGGKLPLAVAATVAGQPPFRMAGYLAQVARLLNVDGYPVIGEADGGRTVQLNIGLLKEQFLGAP